MLYLYTANGKDSLTASCMEIIYGFRVLMAMICSKSQGAGKKISGKSGEFLLLAVVYLSRMFFGIEWKILPFCLFW